MVKNLLIGDPGSIPGSGRSPREGNGYPLQYSCLEISMDRGVWRARAYEVAESDITEVTNTFTFKSRFQRFSSQEGKIVTTWDDGYELILLCYHFAIYMYVLKRYAIYLKHIQCCMSIILIKLEKKKREKKNDFLKLNILFDQNLCKVWTDLPLSFQVNSEVCFSFDDSGHYSWEKTNSQQV